MVSASGIVLGSQKLGVSTSGIALFCKHFSFYLRYCQQFLFSSKDLPSISVVFASAQILPRNSRCKLVPPSAITFMVSTSGIVSIINIAPRCNLQKDGVRGRL